MNTFVKTGFYASLALLGATALPAQAQSVPEAVSFTARVNVDDAPADGTFDFVLELYDAGSGGNVVWTETHDGVEVSDGLAFLTMGAGTVLDAAVFDGAELYLQVTFDSTEMAPRLGIQSVPYAIRAGRAGSAERADAADMADNATSAGHADSASEADTAALLGDLAPDDVLLKGSSLQCGTGDFVTGIEPDTGNVMCAIGTSGGQGPQGEQGLQGDPGTDGAKGDKGDPGDAGANGTNGSPGAKGDKGDAGANGTNGARGAKGDKGDKGDPGDAGANGTNGSPGAKGDKGDPGDAGSNGTNGSNGADGAPGTPGVSNWGIVSAQCTGGICGLQSCSPVVCEVSCPAGTRVLGGGCDDGGQATIGSNRPMADGSGWTCRASANTASTWAICGTVQ
jgi:hypothetical protein